MLLINFGGIKLLLNYETDYAPLKQNKFPAACFDFLEAPPVLTLDCELKASET
jgi:hypothetical protein